MALIKVRATATGFNGGPREDAKSVWAFKGDPKHFVSNRDRGMKVAGEVFMVEESRFTDTWMERLDPAPLAPAPVVEAATPAAVKGVLGVRGRPKKVVWGL